MDQYLVAAASLVAFFALGVGYFIGSAERKSRRFWYENGILHCTGPLKPEDFERLKRDWDERGDGDMKAAR